MWSAPVYAASALLCIISDRVRMREDRADQRSLGGPSSVVAIGPSAVSTVGAVSTSDLPHIDRELADRLAGHRADRGCRDPPRNCSRFPAFAASSSYDLRNLSTMKLILYQARAIIANSNMLI